VELGRTSLDNLPQIDKNTRMHRWIGGLLQEAPSKPRRESGPDVTQPNQRLRNYRASVEDLLAVQHG